MINARTYEAYEKVMKVIDSCHNQRQIPACLNMIDQFRLLFGDDMMAMQLYNNLYEKTIEQTIKISNL